MLERRARVAGLEPELDVVFRIDVAELVGAVDGPGIALRDDQCGFIFRCHMCALDVLVRLAKSGHRPLARSIDDRVALAGPFSLWADPRDARALDHNVQV